MNMRRKPAHYSTTRRSFMNVRTVASQAALLAMSAIGLSFASPAIAAGQPPQAGNYVEMRNYLPTWQEQDGWFDTLYNLKHDFDGICGDTFCSGEYTNLEALNYRCSVDSSTGIIGECVWVFAASEENVDPSSGKVIVKPRIWQCVSPLAPSTSAQELAAALANNRNPLRVTLPRTHTNLHESLSDCLY
jgi:hypothetical protein